MLAASVRTSRTPRTHVPHRRGARVAAAGVALDRADPARLPRIAALDVARALGVLAMVFGHTLDGVLARDLRDSAAVGAYWIARGFTAPLFLMVSGWAVATALSRGNARGLEVLRGRMSRILLLLGIGCGLRWPGWGLDRLAAGDKEVWAHLLAFDALHTIAISLLAASLVFALPWRGREKALLFLALAALAVSLGMRPPAPVPVSPQDLPGASAQLALVQAIGGTSPFPLFPWAAYFFVGSAVGLLLRPDRRSALWMAVAGALLATSNLWTGVGAMPLGHPVLFLWRAGVVLLVLSALTLVPAGLAAHAAPLGRASLGIYAIHVPIVYGWSNELGLAERLGPRLSLPASLAVAALVLVLSVALLRGGRASWRSLSGVLLHLRPPGPEEGVTEPRGGARRGGAGRSPPCYPISQEGSERHVDRGPREVGRAIP